MASRKEPATGWTSSPLSAVVLTWKTAGATRSSRSSSRGRRTRGRRRSWRVTGPRFQARSQRVKDEKDMGNLPLVRGLHYNGRAVTPARRPGAGAGRAGEGVAWRLHLTGRSLGGSYYLRSSIVV